MDEQKDVLCYVLSGHFNFMRVVQRTNDDSGGTAAAAAAAGDQNYNNNI
jgi:hypothetical protein